MPSSTARTIRAHEGRRRQMQYIGKLMRDIDPAPLRAALERSRPARRPTARSSRPPSDGARTCCATTRAVDRFAAEHPLRRRAALSRPSCATRARSARAAGRRIAIASSFAQIREAGK